MAWGGLWRRSVNGTRRSTLMQELTRQANPEWIDRAWLQIGLIRKSAGQFTEAVEAFTTLERVAPGARCGRKPGFSVRWPWCGSSVAPRPKPLIEVSGGRGVRPSRRAGCPGAGDDRARA